MVVKPDPGTSGSGAKRVINCQKPDVGGGERKQETKQLKEKKTTKKTKGLKEKTNKH